jgi:hypothetical protein
MTSGAVAFRTAAGAVGAAVLTVATLGGCTSSSKAPGASGLTTDAVHTAAGKLGSAGGACPLGLDVNAALKAAGVAGTAAPDTRGGPAAEGTTPEKADAGAQAKQYGFSLIRCSYVITDDGTTTDLAVNVGALPSDKKNTVAAILWPIIERDGGLGPADLQTFLGTPFTAGQSKVTPGKGTAVYSQLSGSGSGVGLEVGAALQPAGSTTPPALSGSALQMFATTLATQILL